MTQNLTVDLAYRYLNIGDADAGKSHAYNGSGTFDALEFNDIHSNDIMFAARWTFGCCGGQAPIPVSLK
ncbi:MAG: hypothetical protein WA884_05650 [Methyloceanibacter sp.]